MLFLRWALIAVVGLLVLGYLAYTAFFYYVQREALFPGQHRPVQIADIHGVDGWVPADFNTPYGTGFAWYMPPLANPGLPAPAVIIGHGNGEIADDWVPMAEPLRQMGYAVLVIGYPGFGHAAGEPSKDSIVASAVGGYDWLVAQPNIDPDKVIIFGHSVGGGAVLALADQRPTAGAILLSAFASIDHIARDRYLPPFLAKDRFDNAAVLENYDRPVYLMHGTHDVVVAPYHADVLHAAAQNSTLEWLDCGHGGCIDDLDAFWQKLDPIMQEMISK